MTDLSQYQLLKDQGTLSNRFQFIRSLEDKTQIQDFLAKSFEKSYDDLQIFIFLSNLTKNEENLLKIFQHESLPLGQRILAGKYWIRLQKDVKIVENFLVETINNADYPSFLKQRILKHLKHDPNLRRSCSFFSDLSCRLTSTHNHEEFNIDGNLLPFCDRDQIVDLLSRWSIKSLNQLDLNSSLVFKFCEYHPLIFIQLIKQDLQQLDSKDQKFVEYFDGKRNLIELISKKETKELICLFISYLNQLEKHQRFLPFVISNKMKYFFRKSPNEMIDLITLVASNQIGSLKYRTAWGSQSDLISFSFPRTFSPENFVRLFGIFSDQFHWSDNHLNELLRLMLDSFQQRKGFFDEIILKKIGLKDQLMKYAIKQSLPLLRQYPELTNEISLNLLKKKAKQDGFVKAEDRLEYLRYQFFSKDLFEEFLLLFKQTGSNVNQRQLNYPLLLQSAISTDNPSLTQNAIEFLTKRFTNEQLIVIETFLDELRSFDRHFHLQILPLNLHSIETIFDIAMNHLQRTSTTLSYLIKYSIDLLRFIENKPNQSIETFAIQTIRKSFEKDDDVIYSIDDVSNCFPRTRRILLEIFIDQIIPKLISKGQFDRINRLLSSYTKKKKIPQELDVFLNKFFREDLLSLKRFPLEDGSILVQLFLQNRSTRFERVDFLMNQINRIFFFDENVQRILLHSEQHRSFLDQLLEQNKLITTDQFSNEQNSVQIETNSSMDDRKLPGLSLNVLSTSLRFCTGKEQEYLTNLLIEHFIPNDQVNNRDKLRSLRILRRLTHTYPRILQWIEQKQQSTVETPIGKKGRGASGQTIDDLIICLPSTCDLTREIFFQQFEILKTKINAANAKFISDAMRNISRKVNQQLFFKNYFQLIEDEQFITLGVTANKEILRLLIDYSTYPGLIRHFLQPFWKKNLHDDVRASLLLILLHFIDKSHSKDEEILLWDLLEQSTKEEYSLLIQYLFGSNGNASQRILSRLKHSFPQLFHKYVNQIQFLVLDHPKSVELRSIAWTNIDYEFVQFDSFLQKGEELILQFNQQANHLWPMVFNQFISLFKQNQISSVEKFIEIIDKLLSRRDEIDSKENGIDNQHDLPVYHRIQRLLTNLSSHLQQFNQEKLQQFRLFFYRIILFDPTFSFSVGKLILKISNDKEQIEEFFAFLDTNLPKNYFRTLLPQFGCFFSQDHSIQQLNLQEKIEFVQWFIQKNRILFIWDFLKEQIFNQTNIDREILQNFIQQIRSTDDLFLRQESMEYIVPWDQ